MEASNPQTPEELAEQLKKDELAAAAANAGVEIKASDTKADIAQKLVEANAIAGNTVDDGVHDVDPNPAKPGDWVDIIKGDYAGRHAAYLQDVGDGTIQVRTRDADNLLVELPYASVRLSAYHGGR